MLKKKELIKVLEEFERYYDRMEVEKWNKGQKKLSDYAASMWCLCRKLKLQVAKRRGRVDPFEILSGFKSHYDELIRKDQADGNIENEKRHSESRRSCDKLESRLRTVYRHASETQY